MAPAAELDGLVDGETLVAIDKPRAGLRAHADPARVRTAHPPRAPVAVPGGPGNELLEDPQVGKLFLRG